MCSQDVEAVIGDYDGDVGTRDTEYQAALKEYNNILLQVGQCAAPRSEHACIHGFVPCHMPIACLHILWPSIRLSS